MPSPKDRNAPFNRAASLDEFYELLLTLMFIIIERYRTNGATRQIMQSAMHRAAAVHTILRFAFMMRLAT